MSDLPPTPERAWLLQLEPDDTNPHTPRILLRPLNAPKGTPWTEFTDQDTFLRHLWHLIDRGAGLR